jgi:hypothetical protein
MPNKDEESRSDAGEGKTFEDESTEKDLPRDAGGKHNFDEDTEEAMTLPKVKPEVTADDDDKKKADSASDDLEIEIDENDLKVESEGQTPGRTY